MKFFVAFFLASVLKEANPLFFCSVRVFRQNTMRTVSYPVIFLFLLVLSVCALKPKDCAEKGFSDTLECSKCETMKEFVSKPQLYEECKQCCSDTNNNSGEKKYKTGSFLNFIRECLGKRIVVSFIFLRFL